MQGAGCSSGERERWVAVAVGRPPFLVPSSKRQPHLHLEGLTALQQEENSQTEG